jgi:Tfp pilus assembly major pilin PilA
MSSPSTLSAEERRTAEYEAFVGMGADYYAPRFTRFDSGGRLFGWHWPAFFVSSLWFLYRKMWGHALIYLLAAPFVALILSVIAGVALGAEAGVWCFIALTALMWIAVPLFANFLYWRHARSEINSVAARLVGDARTQEIERRGGTTWWGVAVAFASSFFFVGILAAIAIPAYQDYTIRSQVASGLAVAAGAKVQVEEQYAASNDWPTLGEEEFDVSASPYVDGVYVEDGSVVIRFGGNANDIISKQSVALSGGVSEAGEFVWTCGNAPTAEGVQVAPGPAGSEIPDKYLPTYCRAQ